jgi:hypothetical protein
VSSRFVKIIGPWSLQRNKHWISYKFAILFLLEDPATELNAAYCVRFVLCCKPFDSKKAETHFGRFLAAVWLPPLNCIYSYHCRSSGTKFLCSEVIAPIKSEVDDICLYIINFEDLTAPSAPAEEGVEANHKLSKCEWRLESWTWMCLLSDIQWHDLCAEFMWAVAVVFINDE